MKDEYRDPELNILSAEWFAPEPAADLRSRVLTAFDHEFAMRKSGRRWPGVLVPDTWKGILAGVALGAAMCFLVIGRAFPQSLSLLSGFRIPYVVEWEQSRYRSDGSVGVKAHLTGFLMSGERGIILTETDAGAGNLMDTIKGFMDSGRRVLVQAAPSLMIPQQSSESVARHRAYVRNGCLGHDGETVVGHEMVLGHSTTVVLFTHPDGHERTTQWLASDLVCIVLKQTDEELRSDGSSQVVLRVQALKVTVNR